MITLEGDLPQTKGVHLFATVVTSQPNRDGHLEQRPPVQQQRLLVGVQRKEGLEEGELPLEKGEEGRERRGRRRNK